MSQDLRALLRDRKTKGRKLNYTHPFCLDLDLLDELEDLVQAREQAARPFDARITAMKSDGDRLAAPDTASVEAERDAAVAELDEQIAAKKAEIAEASIMLHFRALPNSKSGDKRSYSEMTSEYNIGQKDADWFGFTSSLMAASFVKATGLADGADTDLSWSDVMASEPNDGELGRIADNLVQINRQTVDFPISSRSSRRTG